MTKQSQKGGPGSLNIQAQTINQGLTYLDAKQLFFDLFEQNFPKLVSTAVDVATQRANQLNEGFLRTLEARNPAGLQAIADPGFLYGLLAAQIAYARTGDKDLGELLVELLVERSKEQDRTLLHVVLDEALQTVGKLTSGHISALSIVFMIRSTRPYPDRFTTPGHLASHVATYIAPFVGSMIDSRPAVLHLTYAGCGSLHLPTFKGQDIRESVERIFASQYPRLFPNKEGGWMLNHEEIKEILYPVHICLEPLCQNWINSYLVFFHPTTVGTAIGHANIQRVTGKSFDLAMRIQ